MVRIKDLYHPYVLVDGRSPRGFFQELADLGDAVTMPWFEVFDPSFLDLEFYSACGDMAVSSIVEDFYNHVAGEVPVPEAMAQLIQGRHAVGWSRVWEALTAEYDPILSAVVEVTREVVAGRDERGNFTATDKTLTGTQEDVTVGGTNTSTEVLNTTVTNDGTSTTSDTETRDLSTSSNTSTDGSVITDSVGTSSGSDRTTKAGTETTSNNNTSSKTGVDATVKSGTESRDGSNREGFDNYGETESGSVSEVTNPNLVTAGSETTTVSSFGMGGVGTPAPDSLNTTESSPALTGESKTTTFDGKTRTYNGAKTTTTSDDVTFTDRRDSTEYNTTTADDGQSVLSFTGREDSTISSGDTTENSTATTDETVISSGTDSGTVKHSGSDITSGVAATTGTNTTTDEHTATTSRLGSVDSAVTRGGDNTLTRSDDMSETSQTRSTPSVKTVQEMVMQEVALRRGPLYNFAQILIDDVRSMTTAKVWPRRGLFDLEY